MVGMKQQIEDLIMQVENFSDLFSLSCNPLIHISDDVLQ